MLFRQRWVLTSKLKRFDAGTTLIELMIAMGLSIAVTLAITGVMRYMYNVSVRGNLTAARSQILTNYRQYAADIKSLAFSLHQTENQAFLNCVCGEGTGCNSGQFVAFSLYQPGDNPPQQNPKYYDANGHPCSSNAPNCLIQVTTQFIAECQPPLPATDLRPPDTCTTPAEMVGVKFIVQQNPATIGHANVPQFKTISGTAYTQVSNITAPVGPGVCP